MLKYFCIAALLAVALANEIKYKDCAKHEVTHVDIVGCVGHDANFCPMQKGKDFKLTVDFVANQDTSKVDFKFTANLGAIEIPVPGVDTDACKVLKCPLVKGQKYSFVYQMTVPKMLPTLKALVNVALVGQHGPLVCLHINGGVQD